MKERFYLIKKKMFFDNNEESGVSIASEMLDPTNQEVQDVDESKLASIQKKF
jgi:hypothetical protein